LVKTIAVRGLPSYIEVTLAGGLVVTLDAAEVGALGAALEQAKSLIQQEMYYPKEGA
jgi:hypothetical protein